MTKRGQNIAIIGTATTLVGTVIFLIVNSSNKKKEIAQIVTILDTGKDADGIAATTQGNAFSPAFWRQLNLTGTIHMNANDADRAKQAAKDIYDSLGYFTIDDDSRVIGVFKTLTSQAWVSMVADAFLTAYQKDLKDFLGHLSSDSWKQVSTRVNNLPAY